MAVDGEGGKSNRAWENLTPQERSTAIGCLAVLVVVLVVVLALTSSCTKTKRDNVVPKAAAEPAQALPPRTHNYSSREGALYCYEGSLSPEQQNAGQAAANVVCFRYLGERDGVNRFSAEAQPQVIVSCANPCETIKTTYGGTVLARVKYVPESIIGAAIQDAEEGQLEPAKPSRRH